MIRVYISILRKKNYTIFLRIDDFTYGRSFILFFFILSLEIKINKIKQHVMLCMHLVQRSFFIMQVLRNTCTRAHVGSVAKYQSFFHRCAYKLLHTL